MKLLDPASAYTCACAATSRRPTFESSRGSSRMTRGELMIIDWTARSIGSPSRGSEQSKVSDP